MATAHTERVLVDPWIVPIRVMTVLASNGVHHTRDVHDLIRAGTLKGLKGVGPAMERKILRYYTREERR